MAQVVNQNQVKLNNGQVVQASTGGWYDGQQFWNGTLSNPGEINAQSNQQGAGQAVSQEVIAQTNPANVAYVNQQRQQAGLTPSPTGATPPAPSTLPGGSPSSPSSASTGTGDLSITQPEAINLPKLYESLYQSSGIRDIEAELATKTNAYNAQVAKIKDNPYLSEATMTGRVKKLDQKFAADTQAIKDDIAMRKADIETQLNLRTKQFDINSELAQRAFQQFQTLLSSGALDNASGEDIANITRATGISSNMIMSAINAQKEAKKKDIPTTIKEFDDGTNQGFVVINSQTGDVINKQNIAASKPTKSSDDSSKSNGLSKSQETNVIKSATSSLSKVDTNKDKLVSITEYKKAIELVIAATGVDVDTADQYLTNQMQSLGYKKWKW